MVKSLKMPERGEGMKWIKGIVLIWLGMGILQAEEPRATLMVGMGPAKILGKAYRFLEEQKAFSVEALTVNEDLYRNKLVTEVRHHLRIDLERPDRIRVRIDGDSKHRDYLMKKGKFLIWDRSYNLYGELETPKSIDGTLDYLYDQYGIATPLANLLYSDLSKRLKPQARGYYFGLRELEGVWCHYIGFVNDRKELQVWVQAEGDPLIHRFVVIDKSTKFRLHSATTLHWLSIGKVSGTPFELTLPADAHRIPVEPAL
jgi:hypothetical protein